MGGLLGGGGGGGGGGGAKGMLAPLSNYWGAWPPLAPPLPTPMVFYIYSFLSMFYSWKFSGTNFRFPCFSAILQKETTNVIFSLLFWSK